MGVYPFFDFTTFLVVLLVKEHSSMHKDKFSFMQMCSEAPKSTNQIVSNLINFKSVEKGVATVPCLLLRLQAVYIKMFAMKVP